jgi:hypothetical protein
MPRLFIRSWFGRAAVVGALLALAGAAVGAEAPKDAAGCQHVSEALYKRAEALQKKTRIKIPREFARVAANLDEFCQDKDFKKALVSIEWMETCLKNWRKPYKLGYCSRGKKYFCAVFPDSEGCKGDD